MKMAIQNWWLYPKCGRSRCYQGRRKQANRTIAPISDATMCSLRLFTVMVIIVCPVMSYAASLGPDEAASHIGENATVCGVVASATYAAQAMAAPTFLDLGKPYPNHIFSAVILGSDRTKFGAPEISLREKQVCVTGEIFLFEEKPEIILRDPKQLREK